MSDRPDIEAVFEKVRRAVKRGEAHDILARECRRDAYAAILALGAEIERLKQEDTHE